MYTDSCQATPERHRLTRFSPSGTLLPPETGRAWIACPAQYTTASTVRAAHTPSESRHPNREALAIGTDSAAAKPAHTPSTATDRKSTRLNSTHGSRPYGVLCLEKQTTRRGRQE